MYNNSKRYDTVRVSDIEKSVITLGRNTRRLVKESKFLKGEVWFKAVLSDIVDTDSTLLAIEGSKLILEQMIEARVFKYNKYLINYNQKKGTIKIIENAFNTEHQHRVSTRLGIAGMCQAFAVPFNKIYPYMEYFNNKSGCKFKAGPAMKHLVFSSRPYKGAEIIKALLKDVSRDGATYDYVKPTIDALMSEVIVGNVKDDYEYEVKISAGVFKFVEKSTGNNTKKIHLHKSVQQLVEEYKSTPTHNTVLLAREVV